MMCLSVVVGGRQFYVVHHAVQRFREREHPELSFQEAKGPLLRLLRGAEIHLTLPRWSGGLCGPVNRKADEYLAVEERLLFPVRDGRVLTCLARRAVGAQVRMVHG